MKIVMIRHGETQGNLEKRYIGKTDQPLVKEGTDRILARTYPGADLLFVSPLLRCRQTGKLIYPELSQHIAPLLKEMDFGEFEGKNYAELCDNPDYQKWMESYGTLPFPGGESQSEFVERCKKGFMEVIHQVERMDLKKQDLSVAFVVHGGTIMAVMSALAEEGKNYYDYLVKNGNGYVCEFSGGCLRCIEKIFQE